MINCNYDAVKGGNQHLSSEGVLLSKFYVANTALVKLNIGALTIASSRNDVLECTGECLILIEKNQTLSINCIDVNNKFDIKLIDIPFNLMSKMYSLFITENKRGDMINIQKCIGSHILSTELRPGMSEAFDNVFNCLKKVEHGECKDCTRGYTDTAYSPLDFELMFLLSAFTAQDAGIGIMARAVNSSLRERIFNMIKSASSRAWCLDDVAAKLYMSRSTIKRKLAIEETSFSEIYLDVRMCMAAKFLRTGGYNINQVAELCGYNRPSYFITTFKRYFQMTPYTFMKLTNH